MAESRHVVVDGSNLATEGRTLPSLEQLDEAVRAYAAEDPAAHIIVVVDATFEHRVSDAERVQVREAMLNGEIISPPAGAIGRGDAFVLRIAERTGAVVLSNDSFQEFHGEHPWLFHDGRLIGGKPVPGVGWIFTPRVPIRGPKSRAATAEAKAKKDPESAPAKAAELARAAKKAAKKAAKAKKSAKAKKPANAAPTVDTSWPITPTTPPPGREKVDPVFSSAIDEAVEEALHPPAPPKPKGTSKKQTAARKGAPEKRVRSKKDEPAAKRDGGKDTAVAGHGGPPADGHKPGRSKRKRSSPPPAVNEPLAFINFVAAYGVGTALEGEVVSFTSHGAMVDVSLPGGGTLHCYIPLAAMGTPPPTKARQVLTKGEVRPFVLAGLDPPRRVAELALLPDAAGQRSASDGGRAKKSRGPKIAAPVTETTAKAATSAEKTTKATKTTKAPKRATKAATAAKKATKAAKATKATKATKKAAKATKVAKAAKKATKATKATKASKALSAPKKATKATATGEKAPGAPRSSRAKTSPAKTKAKTKPHGSPKADKAP